MEETPKDPFSDMVTAAVGLHEWYSSLRSAGFSSDESLRLMGYTMGHVIHLKKVMEGGYGEGEQPKES